MKESTSDLARHYREYKFCDRNDYIVCLIFTQWTEKLMVKDMPREEKWIGIAEMKIDKQKSWKIYLQLQTENSFNL